MAIDRQTLAIKMAQENGAFRGNSLEYRTFLHIFQLTQASGMDHRAIRDETRTSIGWHHTLPWPLASGVKPDYETLMAHWHVHKMAGWPAPWDDFQYLVEDLNGRQYPAVSHWVLLPSAKLETLFTWFIGIKHAARSEVFRLHARPGDPKFDRDAYLDRERATILQRLDPYLIRRKYT